MQAALCTHMFGAQARSVWHVQVFEVFTHIVGAHDDLSVEHGHDVVKNASTELLVHAQLLPVAELEKLSLSTIRSDGPAIMYAWGCSQWPNLFLTKL